MTTSVTIMDDTETKQLIWYGEENEIKLRETTRKRARKNDTRT